uniref:hypothetical protein n=1 Tax=Thaumasiovibrio occultus TaxID=1891184 RepID=UPI000B35D3E0|nr:hypothetical protein [Thaumasiovibrio occultus]
MENNRFFRSVNRFNAVSIMLVFIGVVVLGIYLLLGVTRGNPAQSVAVDTNTAENIATTMKVGELREVNGHNVHWSRLVTEAESNLNVSKYFANQTRNVVFWVGVDMTPSWVFDTNEYLVSSFRPVEIKPAFETKNHTAAFIVESIQADTNNDGILSADDDHTLAFVRPDGSSYTQVYQGPQRLIDTSVVAAENTVIVMQSHADSTVVRKYDLADFSLKAEQSTQPPQR